MEKNQAKVVMPPVAPFKSAWIGNAVTSEPLL